jgi:hypothetical protein
MVIVRRAPVIVPPKRDRHRYPDANASDYFAAILPGNHGQILPGSIAFGTAIIDAAPTITGGASEDLDPGALRNCGDDGIVGSRPATHIHGAVGTRILRLGNPGEPDSGNRQESQPNENPFGK